MISLSSALESFYSVFLVPFLKKNLILSLFISLFIISSEVYSQSLDIGIGFGTNIHNDNYNQSSPPEDPIVPSIGAFFHNDLSLNSVLQLCLFNNGTTPLFHIGYDRDILKTSFDKPFLLGDQVTVNSFEFSLGVGFLFPDSILNFFVFPSLGYVAKFYEGSSDLGTNSDMKINYESGGAIRIGAGVKIILASLPISIFIRPTYDLGTVTRGKINVYENGNYIGEMNPTGDKTLPDNVLSFQLTLAYHLKF